MLDQSIRKGWEARLMEGLLKKGEKSRREIFQKMRQGQSIRQIPSIERIAEGRTARQYCYCMSINNFNRRRKNYPWS